MRITKTFPIINGSTTGLFIFTAKLDKKGISYTTTVGQDSIEVSYTR